MTFLINPNFLCRSLTGIERFAFEICTRLDSLLSSDDDVRIIIPSNAKTVPQYKNIKIIKTKKPIKSFPLWDLFVFSHWCKRLKSIGINFSNTAPLGKNCGISFIHDIYAKQFPQDFSNFKEKLIRLYCCFNYRNITQNAKKILTVSDFSREQIQKTYRINDEKIAVIHNGWEHFKEVNQEIPEILSNKKENSYKKLESKSFYFTLGSLQKRKNLGWLVKYASEHPEEIFAISGKAISGFISNDIENLKKLSNVILLGYVTDSQVKYLMQNCKAFIFPSYYEGFGIPPLEALSVGTKIIVGKAASLPEIYKETAVYIDPYNTNCNLNSLLEDFSNKHNQTEYNQNVQEILSEYTYDKAAQKLYNILKSFNS